MEAELLADAPSAMRPRLIGSTIENARRPVSSSPTQFRFSVPFFSVPTGEAPPVIGPSIRHRIQKQGLRCLVCRDQCGVLLPVPSALGQVEGMHGALFCH